MYFFLPFIIQDIHNITEERETGKEHSEKKIRLRSEVQRELNINTSIGVFRICTF